MPKMVKCKTCGKDIASNSKSCPNCGGKNKKPLYKKVWFWVLIVIVLAGVSGSLGDNPENNTTVSGQDVAQEENNNVVQEENKDNAQVEEKVEDTVSTEYKNALKKAKVYSDTMYMSKAGLYDQLTSEYGEKFPADAAQYAIDNVQANWKENALKKAKTYQETMAMSTSAIYEQLISEYGEKFTSEEAQYAVDNLE